MYVPTPPAVPESCAVMTVLAETPDPLMREFRAMVPVSPVAVSVVVDMVPVNCAEPVATGQ